MSANPSEAIQKIISTYDEKALMKLKTSLLGSGPERIFEASAPPTSALRAATTLEGIGRLETLEGQRALIAQCLVSMVQQDPNAVFQSIGSSADDFLLIHLRNIPKAETASSTATGLTHSRTVSPVADSAFAGCDPYKTPEIGVGTSGNPGDAIVNSML